MQDAGFSPDELIALQRNAIDISWAPPAVKQDFRSRLDAVAGTSLRSACP